MADDNEQGDEEISDEKTVIIERLVKNMQITASARFNAAQRLGSRSRSVNLMLALLASSVIVTSVLDKVHKFPNETDLPIFFSGLAASIFVVVLSLYQWSSHDDVNAEKFHQSGMDISALRRNLELANTSASLDAEEYLEHYNEILKECGGNHDDIDYIRVKLEKSDEYQGKIALLVWHKFLVFVQGTPALVYVSMLVLLGLITVMVMAFHQISEEKATQFNSTLLGIETTPCPAPPVRQP